MSLIFILLGTFFLLAFLGVPIAISLGVASGIGMLTAGVSVSGIAQRMFAGVDSFSYLAIPMFMLAGKLMEYGGISARIVQVAKILCAKVRGGLAITSIVACSFFAALSGSAPATVSAIGGIMYPEMLKDGYDEEFAGGMISVAGNLGPLIPPSILMVTIGVCTGVSISDMFLGGIVIGILLAVVFCLTAYVICRRRNYGGSGQIYSSKEKWRIFWSAMPALGMPIIILGGIYGGYFTPTEASVVAVVYGIIVSFCIYREITVKQFIRALVDSAVAGSVILLMISTSMSFSWIFARQGLSRLIVSGVSSVFTTSVSFMILSFVIFLIFGTFMDAKANALLLLPLMFPVAQSLGINAIHYCIFATGALIIGSSSPPVAVNIFTAVSVTGLPMSRSIKGMLPFFIMMILTVFVYSFFPNLSTFLPNLVG